MKNSAVWRFVVVATLLVGMTTTVSAQGTGSVIETESYSSVGTYSYTVPESAGGLNITISGGAGGDGGDRTDFGWEGGARGDGAQAKFNYREGIDGGETLEIGVGERGEDGESGGGQAGGGGGGGSSAIRFDSNDELIVCAGGGGGGGGADSQDGGAGGDGDGEKGQDGDLAGGIGGTGFFSNCGGGGSGANQDGDGGDGTMDYHVSNYEEFSTSGNSGDGVVEVTAINYNALPQFNSTSHNQCLIGENCSYGAEVYDSDGSIDHTNLTLEYGGFTVVSDLQRSGTTPSWSDVYVPQDGNKWLNATLEVVDDQGAVTTTEIDRFLSDDAPSVSVSNLENQSYFSYSRDVTVSVSDSDSKPSEDITCSLYIDGNQYDTETVVEGNSFTTTAEAGLGSHTFKAECEDPAGNTNSNSIDYTVDLFEVNGLSGSGTVFEKTNQSFSLDYSAGEMVENINYSLIYDGQTVSNPSIDYTGKDEVLNNILNFYHVVPFVGSDGTSKTYSVNAEINYSDFGSGYTTKTETSGSNSQSINHAFKFGSHSLEDGFTQLEASTLEYRASVDNLSSDTLASVSSVETVFGQTGVSRSLTEGDNGFSGSFDSNLVNSSSESFDLSTEVTVSHGGDSRSFTDSKTVTLDKFVLEKSSSGSNAEVLKFISQDEVNETAVTSSLKLGLDVANHDQPDKSRFYGFDVEGSNTHSFYLDPGYGEVVANAFKRNQITYQNQDKNYNKRRYYLIDEVLNNETTKVKLYLLKDSQGQNVQFELLDSDLRALNRHIVRVERSIPDQEDTRVVTLFRTDNEGKATAFVDSSEQYIYTIYNQEGELVGSIGPQGINGLSSTLQLQEEDLPRFDNLINDVRFTDVQEGNESLVVEYTSDTEKLNNISLTVSESGLFGTSLIDSDSSSQLQGRLEVDGFNVSNQSVTYKLTGTFGETELLLDTGTIGDAESSYGDTGIFMGLIMFMAVALSGLWRPSAAIGLSVVGLFVLYFIGFLAISQTALISVAILGALLVWRMS